MIAAIKAASAVSGLPYLWVAAGDSGVLETSDSSTLSTWTSRTSSFGASAIYGVKSDGSTIYVAVGADGKLATSPDGITWTQRTSSFGATNINAVAYGNGTWVAVGDSGKIATATDPTGTWTQRTSGVATNLNCIAYGNGIWVAIGASSVIRTATNPTSTWTGRSSTVAPNNDRNSLRFCETQSVFIFGKATSNPAVARSTNGTSWTAEDLAREPTQILSPTFLPLSNWSVIIGYYLLDGSPLEATVDSSADGITWTARTLATTGQSILAGAVDAAGRMALLGFSGSAPTRTIYVQTSDDGITWTNRTAPTGGSNIYRIFCHSSGG